MKLSLTYRRCAQVFGLGGLLLALAIAAGCGAKPAAAPAAAKPATPASKTNAVAGQGQTTLSNENISVFEYNLLPPKGRDPFYPDSARRNPVPVAAPGAAAHVEPVLVLQAIFLSSKKSEAVVNRAIMEVGEDAQMIHTPPNGHVMAKCLKIGSNYVELQVEGEPGTKILTLQHKKGIEVK